ncbi:MAG: recombination mediator RecR [bacterium]
MAFYAKPIEKLINEFDKMPGIGIKTAERLALYILKTSKANVGRLIQALTEVKEKVRYCSICGNVTEDDPCPICRDENRDGSTICVVEEPDDIVAFERTREYNGLYHILSGVISPLDGIGPNDIRIRELLDRLRSGTVREVIIATNPSIEGEATAMYLSKVIKPLGVKVTRLAMGIPMGGDLEYADVVTLMKALEGRREV